ncbi:Uncharacterised protein [uncultured archaeon]|nr:Uncharacterised protein [uncultured archaeon]
MKKNNKTKGRIDFWQITAYIAVAVIILSALSLGIKLTGYATTFSTLNVTVEEKASINFTIDTIDFGQGSVSTGELSATIDTLGNVINGNWTPVTEGFRIENTGNVNVSLSLKTNKNASDFLGGSFPGYQYNVTDFESGSCISDFTPHGEWIDVNKTGDGTIICNVFQYGDDQDSIRVDLKLVIPSDARPGIKSDVFTATGTAV